MDHRLWVSVSGGRTSMMMARFVQQHMGKHAELKFVFANTGQEHEKTLEFVDRCDREWGLGVVWLEAVTNQGRKGCTHKIVSFETASRKGEPFESMIAKYGIPNKSYPHCNRELKLNPMRSYIVSIGWHQAKVAVGIRADEPKRLRAGAEADGIIYPFAHLWPTDKQDVLSWWEDQPFDLELEEREGNCVWCWKKSDRKHFANIASNPGWYDFPRRMEQFYGNARAERGDQVFFRGAFSTDGLFRKAELSNADPRALPSDETSGGCSESCEAFTFEENGTQPVIPEFDTEMLPDAIDGDDNNSSSIARFDTDYDKYGEYRIMELTDGDYVLHADHLASHQYDEAKERALFEAEVDLRQFLGKNKDGSYATEWVREGWHWWQICAKSRAKAAGCE
jgi:hypothetical protein